jgi:hypothetical protein
MFRRSCVGDKCPSTAANKKKTEKTHPTCGQQGVQFGKVVAGRQVPAQKWVKANQTQNSSKYNARKRRYPAFLNTSRQVLAAAH